MITTLVLFFSLLGPMFGSGSAGIPIMATDSTCSTVAGGNPPVCI